MDNVLKRFTEKLRWYYWTRFLGSTIVLFELFLAQGTPERGTILVVGAGMLGFDSVVRKADSKS
jgi:hypothetical protein